MNHKHQAILSLICLVSFIYVLRDHKTSPVGFLQHQTSRLLQSSTSFSAVLCDGVDRDDPITDSERESTANFRSSISNLRGGNLLVTYLNSSLPSTEFASEYVPPLVKTAIPWAVFFVISLVGCIGFVTNWCCMNCCECGPQCCKKPKTPRFQKAYKFASAFFMVLTFGAGIAGIAMSSKFPPAGKQFLCSTAVMIDKLIEGSRSDRWVGVLPAINKLIIVLDNLETVSNKLPLVLVPQTAVGAYGATRTAYTLFQTLNNQKSVARGDKTVSSTYIPSYTGNMTSSNAGTGAAGALIAELEGKNSALNTGKAKYDGGALFLKAPTFILGAMGVFQDVRDVAYNVSKNITEVQESFVESGSAGRTGMDAIGGGMIGVFALKMLIAFLSMVAIILVSRGCASFNKILHCNWCTLGFIVILGWVLAVVLFPLSIVLFEACEVVETVLTNEAFFNKTMDKVFNDTNKTNDDPDKNSTRNTLYRCIYGDGDLLADYRTYLFPFQNISDALDLMAPLDASAGPVVNSVQLDRQIPLVNNYRSGSISDAPEATTDLAKLNSYTNNDGCSQVRDTWLFASNSCGANDGAKFESGAAADYNVGSQTCIGFDNWPANSPLSIMTRYTSARYSGCPQVSSKTPEKYRQDFVNDFKTSRKAVTDLFTDLASSLGNLKTSNDAYMNSVLAYTDLVVKPVRRDYDVLYQALSNKTEGIMPNTYCTFVKASLVEVEERLCYRFAPVIFTVAIVMIISSFLALFSVIMVFCSAKRNVIDEKPAGHDRRGKYKSASRDDF